MELDNASRGSIGFLNPRQVDSIQLDTTDSIMFACCR